MLSIIFVCFLETSTLLNTVLKHKVINTQFEVDFKLACIDASHLCNYLTQIEDKEEEPNDSLTLQSSHLEDSNFKNQFFVTRCSFQVKTFFFISGTYTYVGYYLFSVNMCSFDARICEHGVQKD